MGAGLVRNSKITAGRSPLGTVGRQSSSGDAPVTVVGQKMSQLMEQGFLNLPFGDPLPFQGRIQPNLPLGRNGDTGRRPHTGVPTHNNKR